MQAPPASLEMIRVSEFLLHFTHFALTNISSDDEFSDSDSEEFHYPTASPSLRTHPPSIRSSSADYFGSQALSIPTDLSPHLSQAVEFRVPTHDTPQKAVNPGWRVPEAHALDVKWEADADAVECHECKRRFTFILRKVRSLLA
jgi:hypothetical protein